MSNEQLLILITSILIPLGSLILIQARSHTPGHEGRDCAPAENMKELRGEIGELRERMAHLEGLLEGLREAITRQPAA